MAVTWKKLAFDADVVKHSLATAASDFLVASGAGAFVKKTLAETRTILSLPALNYAVGDLLYASSTTALSKLAAVAAGHILTSGGVGVAPAWSADIGLPSGATRSIKVTAGAGNDLIVKAGDITVGTGGNLYLFGGAGSISGGSVLVGGKNLIIQGVFAKTSCGDDASGIMGVGTGAPPTTFPTDMAQLWVADLNGAGTAGLKFANEDGIVRTVVGAPTSAIGDLLYASAVNTWSLLADVAVGSYLRSGGVGAAPSWATLNQAAVAGLTTADGPTFAHLHISGLAAIYTAAESWIGPSSTAGIYFKSDNFGLGTTNPVYALEVSTADAGVARLLRQRSVAPTNGMNVGNLMLGVEWTPTSTKYTAGEVRCATSEIWTVGTSHGTLLAFLAVPSGSTTSTVVACLYGEANFVLGNAAPGTSAAKVFAVVSGTAPSTAPADMAQLWVQDVNAAAGYAGLHKRTETTNQVEVVPGVIIKTDTGSPANPYEGLMEINTYDNKIRMYGDAGWRELCTW